MDETLQGRVESKLARVAELNAQKDAMSDTTGWDGGEVAWRKEIGPATFHIFRANGGFEFWACGTKVAFRDTLEECQILAHDTARLWAGESE